MTASVLLNMEVCICHGSSTDTSPATASTTAIHCSPWMRSCRIGHANTITQKGMVKTRIDVLPGPPSESAHVLSKRKAPVWIRPMISKAFQCCGLRERPVHHNPASKVSTPSSRRIATTSIELA